MGICNHYGIHCSYNRRWNRALEGGILTGFEFAIGGFGAGLGGGWAQTGSFEKGLEAGAGGFASGFVAGFAVGYSYTAGWQSVLHGVDTRAQSAKAYQQKIIALRADCKDRPDKVFKIVGDRYLAGKSGDPGKFGPKHRFIGLRDPWEMGPYKGMINTSNTVEDLSTWGTHITTQRAIASRAINIYRTNVSASGLKEAQALFEQYFAGQRYMMDDRNSNFAVNTVIYGAGGHVPENDLWTMGFPGKIRW